ncbi:F-box/FBD/LRR-repeat protein At1g13570-like [Bidens hawaiensis]|uniref:F-box/FBD/LRR-repeat protein At1g13570-like n=1 Tax=Bidens hawaiensis TaxID=980011 RepID=UPI0040497803
MKVKRLSEAQRLDIISKLPQPIIESILCLLSIDEAVRTSILSRDWRYKWTTIPKLAFHEHILFKRMTTAIHQVLLMRQAPIQEFTFSMDADDPRGEIDQIIFQLSRNHPVKKLTLEVRKSYSYKLPLSLFSMHHLIELNLDCCDLVHQPIFNGFGSLASLSLVEVNMSKLTLQHLLSKCPSLKRLHLSIFGDDILGDEISSIMELFKCLPVIEHLTTLGSISHLLLQDSVPQELSISLIHLKYFCMGQLDFGGGFGLPFVCVLIKCSPNLEKIKLEDFGDECYAKMELNMLEKYSVVWLEHLNELEIEYVDNSMLLIEFVKSIMVRSPKLKKVILRHLRIDKNEEFKMLKVLLHAPHASPVKINVESPS